MKFNILLVDDDIINRKLIKTLLFRHKNIIENLLEASNGKEALDILSKNKNINLILLDIIMPIMNGKEFLKIFRSQRKFSHIPVIVLTTDDTKKNEILNFGADKVLIKPIKEEDLLKNINYWIK